MKKRIMIGKNKSFGTNVQIGVEPYRKIGKLELRIGTHAIVRSGTVIYLGSKIGDYLQTGHNAQIREENEIGDHFSLWGNSIVDYGCKIGDHVKIHSNCYVAQYTTIEDHVFVAPGTIVANDYHPGSPDAVECLKGPTIKKGAQIGCNVTLLPGVTIGERALIGAGSVVTKDIPPDSLAYGNPARVVKKVSEVHCRFKDHFPYRVRKP